MAGIRGAKNPMPTKPAKASGLFKQRGSGPNTDNGMLNYSLGGGRVGPKSRNNKLPSNTSSQRSAPELIRGTAKR